MNYKIQNTENFNVELTRETHQPGVTVLHIVADTNEKPQKLNLTISWQIPNIGIHATWSPGSYSNKEIVPEWGGFETSCAMSLAPVFAAVSYDDKNKQTIACSDGKNKVQMHTGVIEENGYLDSVVRIYVDYSISHYEVDIRIDSRELHFYKVLDDVRKWWEGYEGYAPATVPESAYLPVYSTWYSFHQEIDVPAILDQCRYFSSLGCKTLIVDDGWQTDNTERGYDYCGDWHPTHTKIADMKDFVDAVHQCGMKFLLWYSVPYIGAYSDAYTLFKDKMLCKRDEACETYVVDPRYPEVREYLIGVYKQAVLDWGLDGFKLDFVDAFVQSDVVKDGMDYVSVYDAVDRLLKDVIQSLRELKADILIEFRQSYMGPLMRTFGNLIRSYDCPNDSWSNGMNTLALRMTCGETAVHSDMVMWNEKESAELAAFQLTHTLFSVPQISVRYERITTEQTDMVKRYMELWVKYRYTLLFGEMLYKGYVNNYPYVSSRSENVQVGAVYAGRIAYIEVKTPEIVLFNASLDNDVLIDIKNAGEYWCSVYDCYGREIRKDRIVLDSLVIVNDVPINGVIVLQSV